MNSEVNCLLVDDAEENLLAMRAVLEEEGVTLHLARSGEEALELLLQHDFALAFVDVHMPGMNGIELAEVMRGSERTKQIPIIFVTGGTWDQHRVFQGYESGAVDFLYKPIDPHVVRSKVRVFAELKRNVLALEGALTEAQSTRRSLRLLADSGGALMSSLDRDHSLTSLAKVLVPGFADALVIDVREAGGEPFQFAFDPDAARLAELRSLSAEDDGPVGRSALGRGRSSAWFASSVSDPQEPLSRLGFGSLVTASMEAHGRRFGALKLLRSGRRAAFSPSEHELAEELARRLALMLDNVRLFEEAERSIRMRDEFLSVASHELRTPLTSMGLQIQRAVRLLTSDPSAAGSLGASLTRVHETLHRQAKTLQGLIEDMLDVTRASTGALVLERKSVSLGDLVSDVVEKYAEQLAAAGCRVTLAVEPDCVGLLDARRLEQVVGNLLSNAAKYAAGAPVHVSLQRRGSRAILCVRDEGKGISSEALTRIFERYERASGVEHLPGLGLGLYVVRQIVLVHGGDVRVESRPGQGTSFYVELPLAHRPEKARAQAVFVQ